PRLEDKPKSALARRGWHGPSELATLRRGVGRAAQGRAWRGVRDGPSGRRAAATLLAACAGPGKLAGERPDLAARPGRGPPGGRDVRLAGGTLGAGSGVRPAERGPAAGLGGDSRRARVARSRLLRLASRESSRAAPLAAAPGAPLRPDLHRLDGPALSSWRAPALASRADRRGRADRRLGRGGGGPRGGLCPPPPERGARPPSRTPP